MLALQYERLQVWRSSSSCYAAIDNLHFLNRVLTDQHIAEALSRAHVRAIAGRAGLNLAIWEHGTECQYRRLVMTPKALSHYPQIQELRVALQ